MFDLFPSSPHVVVPSDTMVLHAEISTTTERIDISWHHSSEIYSNFIFEDPFCNPQLEVGTIRQYYINCSTHYAYFYAVCHKPQYSFTLLRSATVILALRLLLCGNRGFVSTAPYKTSTWMGVRPAVFTGSAPISSLTMQERRTVECTPSM